MNNNKTIISIIKSMSGQSNVLTIPRLFIDIMGSIEGGLLLSQMIYWSDRGGEDWFYKKMSEWEEETTLSSYKVRKYSDAMVAQGWLDSRVKKDASGTPVTHYKFNINAFVESVYPDYEKFNSPLSKDLRMESEKTSQSTITETTNIDYKEGAQKNAQHPAVSAYREIFKYNVNRRMIPHIVAAIGDSENNIAVWRAVLEKWLLKGYSPKNFDGMIDVFNKGGFNTPRKGERNAKRNEQPNDGVDWSSTLNWA